MRYPSRRGSRVASVGHHTFLFTDLVGFTALTFSQGDDRAADVAGELYERVRRLLPEHGGEEVKTLGDGVMLRCERPAGAIHLGLGLMRHLEEVPGFPPVRVGMHTGPAVHRDGDWYGTTVNVAARLCAAAGGGEVLVSEHTCEAAERLGDVELSEPRLHWLRNLSQPVGARVASERSAPGRWTALRRLRAAGAGCGWGRSCTCA
jgi:adenylate cyclase